MHKLVCKTFPVRGSADVRYTGEVWLIVNGRDLPISIHEIDKTTRRESTMIRQLEQWCASPEGKHAVKVGLYLLGLGRRPLSTLNV